MDHPAERLQVFDIETGPQCLGEIEHLMPPFDESAYQPTRFDPGSVALGNIKDEAKRLDKICAAEQKHNETMANLGRKMAEDRVAHEATFLKGAALDATIGKLICVGFRDIDGKYHLLHNEDEPKLLNQVFGVIGGNYPICGWNIHGFDLPFLLQRAVVLGIDFPTHWVDPRGYWQDRFVDLMKRWTMGRREYKKLDYVGLALGLGGKTDGVDGADFHLLWKEDRKLAEKYVQRDVELTYQIALRMAV